MSDRLERLTQLGKLRDQGVLTDDEFEAEKAAVLADTSEDDARANQLWDQVLLECKVSVLSEHYRNMILLFIPGPRSKVHGALRLTGAGLHFKPNKGNKYMDALWTETSFLEDEWKAPWAEIRSAFMEGRGSNNLSGSHRAIAVELQDGTKRSIWIASLSRKGVDELLSIVAAHVATDQEQAA